MPPNARAWKVHEELFGTTLASSTLPTTDPDLLTTLSNFAFDELLQHTSLPTPTRLLVQLAAIVACHAEREFRNMLGAALDNGVTPVQAKELVYQAVPYVGVAKAIDFVVATNEVLAKRGVSLPLPSQSTTTPETRMEKGEAVQREIIGDDVFEKLKAGGPADLAHVRTFLQGNCFGDHLTRSGIDVPTRELITLSFLVAQGGCDAQVRGHVAANIHVGNDRAKLIDVITQLIPFIGYPRTLNGLNALNEVAPPEKKE